MTLRVHEITLRVFSDVPDEVEAEKAVREHPAWRRRVVDVTTDLIDIDDIPTESDHEFPFGSRYTIRELRAQAEQKINQQKAKRQ